MYEERGSAVGGAVVWRGESGGSRRVLPDGCMDLLLWGGQLVVAGPDTRAHVVTDPPGTPVTGLRFAPGAGPRVFGVPAHELRDLRVPLAALWPERAVRELTERAMGERVMGEEAGEGRPTWGSELERAALRRLADAGERDLVPRAVLTGLRAGLPVREIAVRTGLSERQLHRRCAAAFGYGPKVLERVLRMRRALRLARAGRPLAEVAALAGYADQPHLSREVRTLAGVPMRELL